MLGDEFGEIVFILAPPLFNIPSKAVASPFTPFIIKILGLSTTLV